MPDGGSLSIREGCVTREGTRYASLEVRDTGVGIPPENLGRIFEPFFTTKSDNEARGLGLSLSRDILSQVGGFIDVASAGGGTAFTVFIPCPERDYPSG
jgi:two-component system cell cycle sensor histidine kinase/response regulator CckA